MIGYERENLFFLIVDEREQFFRLYQQQTVRVRACQYGIFRYQVSIDISNDNLEKNEYRKIEKLQILTTNIDHDNNDNNENNNFNNTNYNDNYNNNNIDINDNNSDENKKNLNSNNHSNKDVNDENK